MLRGFIIDILDPQPLMTEITAGYNADFVLPLTDSMYVVNYLAGNSLIKRYADETVPRLACVFWTRAVILPRPANMGVMQLVGRRDGDSASNSATCTVYADGVAVFTHTFILSSAHGQRFISLPSGFKARRWSVRIAADADIEISELNLAGTKLELMTV
jgi:hypothetical protein